MDDAATAPDVGLCLTFGVLGPLTVLYHGEQLAVGGPKERVVLAHLLARANQVVTVDALVESLWGNHPPRSAERSLQAYVARLRATLEPGRPAGAGSTVLVKAGAGYRLCVEPSQLDALRFEELARRGATLLRSGDGEARSALHEALDLWRGDALGEFLAVDACEAEARRLEEMRLVVIEDRLDAELAGGAASELVAELESLVAQHEFRERLWAQLMLALYRSGRQGDALAAYRRARGVLVDQLGVEPGRELRALEAAILDQDPALDLQPRSGFGLPAVLEAVGPAFVGRTAELAWLRTAWLDAADGRGGFVSVLGPEGIGKTRLLAELAREVQRSGGVVLYGRCGETGAGVRGVLDQAFGGPGLSPDDLDGVPVGELGATVVQVLDSLGRTVLLAIDDVQRADTDTIEVLADLAAWSDAGSLLVVAAFRTDGDAPERAEPGHGDVGSRLVLRGLDRDALRRVCEMYAADGWWPDDIDRLLDLTGGVPLRVHELASEWARDRAVREVGAAADRSSATQARLAGLRAEIAESVEGIQHVLDQRRANAASRRAEQRRERGSSPAPPYKGLAAFEPRDAADYFGRERLVAELVARLAGSRLLAVVGPSGCGKSSLVRAGLVPALEAGVLPTTGGWMSVIATPATPHGRTVVADVAAGRSPSGAGRRMLFVDQLEELFTSGADRDDQEAFVGDVVAAARRVDCVVVVAVRADHLDRCASFPELAELMTGSDVLVGPMRDVELRRAIERPALQAGATFEAGLVERVVADVAGRAGALPLLSTALAETWERRTDGVLTLGGYRSAGGVNGALARVAEDAYMALGRGPRQAARHLLLRLGDAGEVGSVDLRRRLPTSELAADDDAREALAAFVERRLLVVDRDTVEVAHEALLREWPRLRAWMDEDVQGRRAYRRLSDAARAWAASGEDPSELYRGTRLDAALDWAAAHPGETTATEQAFLDASTREAARELDDAHRRAAVKARDNRRLRWSLIGVAGLLVLALVAGLMFVRQRDRAEKTAREARARELASESIGALEADPELGILLALEAVAATEPAPLPEAINALQRTTQASRLLARREEAIRFLDVSADGAQIATGSASERGAVILLDAETGEPQRTLPPPSGADADAQDALFSPDGRLLVVDYYDVDRQLPPAVVIWDSATGDQVARLPLTDDVYAAQAWSPDGRRLLTVSEGGGNVDDLITMWDVAGARELFSFELDGLGGAPSFSPDGAIVVIPEGTAERVGLYSAADGTRLDDIPTPGFQPEQTSLHEAGELLALGSQRSREVQIVDMATREVVRKIPVADVGPLDWSTDGALLAVAGANSSPVRVLDAATGDEVLVLRGHTSGSWDAAFLGDGDRLASVGYYGELRIWDVTPDGPPTLGAVALGGAPWDVEISPDGTEMIVSTDGGVIHRIATGNGEILAERAGQLVGQLPYLAPVSPDWRFVASVDEAGHGAVLDLDTLAPVAPLPPCTSPVGFSPDGALLVLQGTVVCVSSGGGVADPPPGADLRNRVVDVASGRVLLDLEGGYLSDGTFSPDEPDPVGRFLAVNIELERAELYDVADWRLVATVPVEDGLWHLRFDPTGRWLIGATGAGRVWALDVAAVVAGTPTEEAMVLDLVAHDGGIPDIAVSADGTLATTDFGETVRLWDLASGELLGELRTGGEPAASTVAFSADGSSLWYSDNGVLRRYARDVDELVALAHSRLSRGLTADECRQYLGRECS